MLLGGDGSDVLIGNQDLDQLFGGDGLDSFVAETIEVRDLEAGEVVQGPASAQLIVDSTYTPLSPVVDIPDTNLRVAIGEALGIPITTGFNGLPRVSRPLTASDLATLTELDLTGRGIHDLSGLEFATNLRRLYLGWNYIDDLSPLEIGENNSTGPANFEILTLDANAISDLSPLSTLTALKTLSLDLNPIFDIYPLSTLDQLGVL